MAFMHMAVGDRVVAGGGEAMITHVVSAEQVIVRELITGVVRQVPVRTLRPAAALATPRLGQPDLSLVSDEDWTVAQVRYAAIKPLLEAVRIDRFALKQAAAGTGRHPATIYRWLRRYREERHQTALIPVKRGGEPGHSRLQPEVEAIIDAAIKDRYLTRNRVKATQLNRDVALKCRSAGLPIPHVNTVRNRISRIEPRTLVEGRSGKRAAQEQFEPIQGHFPSGNRPLAVVQIDHTKLDLIVVDQAERRPLARPWLTVAIDVFSRVVAGFYLSLEDRKVESPFIRNRRRLDQEHPPCAAKVPGFRGVQFDEAADEHRLAVIGIADQQQVGHAMASGVFEQVLELFEDRLRPGISNPERSSEPGDALVKGPVEFCRGSWDQVFHSGTTGPDTSC